MPEGVFKFKWKGLRIHFLFGQSLLSLSALKYVHLKHLPLKYVGLALLRPWMAKLKF